MKLSATYTAANMQRVKSRQRNMNMKLQLEEIEILFTIQGMQTMSQGGQDKFVKDKVGGHNYILIYTLQTK